MNIFKIYAQYYDLLYKDKEYKAEIDYIENLIKKYAKKPVKSILDLGCGTGEHAFRLAQNGFIISGVDISEEMISIAREKKKKFKNSIECSFIHGDVRSIILNQKFDSVIALFHVASYQISNDDLGNFIKTASLHINEGGVFIFDFWFGPAVLTDLPTARIKRISNEKLNIIRIAEPVLDYLENMVIINYEIIVEQKKTRKIEKLYETHKMRYLFYPELSSLLKNYGFNDIRCLKWQSTEEILDITSWYGLIIANK